VSRRSANRAKQSAETPTAPPRPWAQAARYARAHGIRITLQGTGHGAGPLEPLDGAMLLRATRMRKMRVSSFTNGFALRPLDTSDLKMAYPSRSMARMMRRLISCSCRVWVFVSGSRTRRRTSWTWPGAASVSFTWPRSVRIARV
jgi:hypothetical protein